MDMHIYRDPIVPSEHLFPYQLQSSATAQDEVLRPRLCHSLRIHHRFCRPNTRSPSCPQDSIFLAVRKTSTVRPRRTGRRRRKGCSLLWSASSQNVQLKPTDESCRWDQSRARPAKPRQPRRCQHRQWRCSEFEVESFRLSCTTFQRRLGTRAGGRRSPVQPGSFRRTDTFDKRCHP